MVNGPRRCKGFFTTDTALIAVLGPLLAYWLAHPYEGNIGIAMSLGYLLGVTALGLNWGHHVLHCQSCRFLARRRLSWLIDDDRRRNP